MALPTGKSAFCASPGGSQIIPYVAKTPLCRQDAGGVARLEKESAGRRRLPNVGNRNGPTELEQNSGIQAIVVTPDGFIGGADSRREGVAVGN